MKIIVKNEEGIILPKGNEGDSGYDIFASSDGRIVGNGYQKSDGILWQRIDYIEYSTNIKISPEDDIFIIGNPLEDESNIPVKVARTKYHTLLHPRSSISKMNLVLSNSVGLVDGSYRGEILFRFKYIFQPEDLILSPAYSDKILCKVNGDKIYKKGDRIGQLVASKTIPIQFELKESLDETFRGEGAFGSTGK